MAGGLDPRAREIQVPELADDDLLAISSGLLDQAEKGAAFVTDALGRDVDVSVARQWRRGDVEEFLLQ